MTLFYLGTHRPHWLTDPSMPPLFVSLHTLERYRSRGDDFPKAQVQYAIDSGGFTELRDHGNWRRCDDDFGGMVYRIIDDLGRPPDFVAPQDWMCEPAVRNGGVFMGQRFVGTGLTVRHHQQFTVENLVYLREEFPHAPWIPVLQGWTIDDYLRHVDDYAAAGVDLTAERLVGLGSVCRRQSTAEIGALISTLAALGIRLHGFGMSTRGLARNGQLLASADSMAWSYTARRDRVRVDGCTHRGPCNNCPRWARQWRQRVLDVLTAPQQLDLLVQPVA